MKPTWIIDDYIFRRGEHKKLTEAIANNGGQFFLTQYIPFSEKNDEIPKDFEEPFIFYGTHGYIINARKNGYKDGIYCAEESLSTKETLKRFKKWMLNAESRIMLFNTFVYMREELCREYGKLHIRPNNCDKTFTGFVTSSKTWKDDMQERMNYSVIPAGLEVAISPYQEIDCEMRFFVINGEVVTGSTYRYENVLDIRTDIFDGALDLAKQVAAYEDQPDVAYTVDIAKVGDEFKIIELNSFSCAGLYASDTDKIVKAMNKYYETR